jgi:hypothetical protein
MTPTCGAGATLITLPDIPSRACLNLSILFTSFVFRSSSTLNLGVPVPSVCNLTGALKLLALAFSASGTTIVPTLLETPVFAISLLLCASALAASAAFLAFAVAYS